jgi:hypothetical protein
MDKNYWNWIRYIINTKRNQNNICNSFYKKLELELVYLKINQNVKILQTTTIKMIYIEYHMTMQVNQELF